MKQKIIKIGNSAGIILPQKILKDLEITIGTSIVISILDGSILITPMKEKKEELGMDPELKKFLKEFLDKHDDVLRELAKR